MQNLEKNPICYKKIHVDKSIKLNYVKSNWFGFAMLFLAIGLPHTVNRTIILVNMLECDPQILNHLFWLPPSPPITTVIFGLWVHLTQLSCSLIFIIEKITINFLFFAKTDVRL